jgi:Putative MetA-pathway of phenol degradation
MTQTIRPFSKRSLLLLCFLLSVACVAQGSADSSDTPLDSLGPKPEDEEDLRSVFLRDASVILPPGTWDLEVGLEYRRAKTDDLLSSSDLTRQIRMPLTARFGIRKGLEGLVSVPLIHSYREVSESGTINSDDETGLGDVSMGASFQIMQEKTSWPELLGSVQVRAPSGDDPYRGGGTRPPLGSGHWALAASLQWVRTTDPLVLFGGIGYVHQFSRDSAGRKYQPGPGVQYSMGLGFSVNDDVSLSGRFAGVLQGNWEIDDETVEGSSYEPMTLRVAATMRCRRNMYLEPAVSFGLNDDAADVFVGASLIMRVP